MTHTPRPEAPENDSMLLPCPFCGGKAELDHLTDEDDFFVSCNICEVQQIANYRPHAAIDNWNKRADARRPAASEGEGGDIRRWRDTLLGYKDDGSNWNYKDLVAVVDEMSAAIDAASKPPQSPSLALAEGWHDGVPPKPWREEWFIAETTFNDRVVLKALPEEFAYDFKTADETYIKKDKIKRWMQFPDSGYILPATENALAEENRVLREALTDMLSVTEVRWRGLPNETREKRIQRNARAALSTAHPSAQAYRETRCKGGNDDTR